MRLNLRKFSAEQLEVTGLDVDAREFRVRVDARQVARQETFADADLEHGARRASFVEQLGDHVDEPSDQAAFDRILSAILLGLELVEILVRDHEATSRVILTLPPPTPNVGPVLSAGAAASRTRRRRTTYGACAAPKCTISSAIKPVAKICTPTTTPITPKIRSGRLPMDSPSVHSTVK